MLLALLLACGSKLDTGSPTSLGGGDRGDTGQSGLDTGLDTGDTDPGAAPDFTGEHALADATVRLYATEEQQHTARTIGVGDLDGDGDDDLVVTTVRADDYSGGAWILTEQPPGGADLEDVAVRVHSTSSTVGVGRAVGIGDTDGDGLGDVLLGAPYPGSSQAFLLISPTPDDLYAHDAYARFVAPDEEYAGHGVALTDMTGDGLADVMVGAYKADHGGVDSGVVYVVNAPFDAGVLDLRYQADATLVGARADDATGRVLAAGLDVDGDGLGDLLSPSVYADFSGGEAGAVHLALGPLEGTLDLEDAEATFTGEDPNDWAGIGVALGDLDGDGYADIIIGARGDEATYGGEVYGVHGPVSGELALGDSPIILSGSYGQALGWGLAARDLNRDDRAELLVGALGDTEGEVTPGAAYLFIDLAPGRWTTGDADARFVGESDDAYTGMGVGLGDLDGDGWGDVIVGAPLESRRGGTASGAVYIQTAQGL